MLVVVGLFVAACRFVGPRVVVPGEPVLPRRKAVMFGLGVLALWVHADWPIHDIGEGYLFSVHMIQHTGFTLIAPALLILGMPGWLTRWLFVDRLWARRAARVLFRPLVAGLVYNLVTVLTHWPLVVNASLENHPLHFFVHLVLFFSAFCMWFPVLNTVPDLPTTSPPFRMLYLFLQSVIPTIPASFLTFGETPLYAYYAEVPRLWGMSAVEDMQLAGALMKVYAGSILWGVIVGVFFRWYAAEEKQRPRRRPDAVLTWDEVQRELDRTAPTGSG